MFQKVCAPAKASQVSVARTACASKAAFRAPSPSLLSSPFLLMQNPYAQAALLWVAATLLLYLLSPPLVCNDADADPMNVSSCNFFRLLAWAGVAPVAFMALKG